MPDAKPHTLPRKPKKTVRWAEDVYITLDAEAAYAAATQGILVIPPPEAVAEPDELQLPEAAATDEDNQSHLSDSEREGNLEEPLLAPDVQVNSVVLTAPETHPSADLTSSDQEVPAHAQPLSRSGRQTKQPCYQLPEHLFQLTTKGKKKRGKKK